MKLSLKQHAAYKGNNWWEWSVWVEGEKEDLKRIEFVEYTLHPTFPDPVRRVINIGSKFRLNASGWGGFTIRALVVTKSGEKKTLRHNLQLDASAAEAGGERAAAKGAAEEGAPRTFFLSSNVSDAMFAGVLEKALRDAGAKVRRVTDESSDLPFEDSINKALAHCDFALFIISATPSAWTKREVEAAGAHGIPIIPVLIMGSGFKFPQFPFETLQPISIKSGPPEQFETKARGVVKQIMNSTQYLTAGSSRKKKAAKR